VRKEVAEKKKKEAAEKKLVEKEKRDLERAKKNAAKRAKLQQEAKDRAHLLATLRAANEEEDDASDFENQPTQKIRMLDELRNPTDF
jgi:hypothetical protein